MKNKFSATTAGGKVHEFGSCGDCPVLLYCFYTSLNVNVDGAIQYVICWDLFEYMLYQVLEILRKNEEIIVTCVD